MFGITVKAHLGTPGQSHHKILNLEFEHRPIFKGVALPPPTHTHTENHLISPATLRSQGTSHPITCKLPDVIQSGQEKKNQ